MDERLPWRRRRWHFKSHFLTQPSETVSLMDAVVHPSISVRSLMRSSVYRSTSRSLHHAILCVLLVHHLPFVPPSPSPLPISLHLCLIASFHICISSPAFLSFPPAFSSSRCIIHHSSIFVAFYSAAFILFSSLLAQTLF